MYCRFCGNEIPEDSNYCSLCGKEIGLQGAETQQLGFIKENNQLFCFVLSCIYPFTVDELRRYKNKQFWGCYYYDEKIYNPHDYQRYKSDDALTAYGISTNQNIKWTTSLTEEFKEKISLRLLFQFGNYFLDRIIENKPSLYQLSDISSYRDIALNEEFMTIIIRDYSWNDISEYLWIKSDISLIEKYEDYWNWDKLSYNENIYWTVDLLEKYESKLNWSFIKNNRNVKWTVEFLKKKKGILFIFSQGGYMDVFYTEDGGEPLFVSENSYGIDVTTDHDLSMVLINELFIENSDFDVSYRNRTKLPGFSLNRKIIWSDELIHKYQRYWDWDNLSSNESIPFNEALLEKYKDRWNWINLSSNRGVKWDIDLVNKYRNRINLGTFSKINEYNGLEITLGLDSNSSTDFSPDLIEKYFDEWNWEFILHNPSVVWTKSLLLRYINNPKCYELWDDEDNPDYVPQREISPQNFGFNTIDNLWKLIFKEIVDKYGIEKLLEL